ncbi:ScbR family autoregulator-binding transcription factor [Streptomyces agglomeratus]|uniref:ScbR family autoregulator-binding transcription factor n=1 Tax=Streptomyces agglomeratus TaxID=285458 RepID=UPI000854417B|nr:ScbR family autoregulator-binding transcription factor [Streptomyces agglomeratus]OEJ36277.1 gamma-butyrolactone-binding protein [Streptomyces agglomeratus]
MAEQLRAIRTRQTILSAAAKIFEEHGYQAATISQILAEAGVTKGALYFHFQSKEDLAQGVLAEQDQRLIVPQRPSKVQEIVDVVMLHAHRLQTDAMVRAGVRLTMDQLAQELDRSGPFMRWSEVGFGLLQQAQAQGELLPHIIPSETADVIVGSFSGIQSMSQAICDYRDLAGRVSALMRHVLPSVVVPSVLASLDLTESRGANVYAEALKAADAQNVLAVGV